MFESPIALANMTRTTLAINELKKNNLPYLVCLTDPTAGGITASYAMLGDLHIAESDHACNDYMIAVLGTMCLGCVLGVCMMQEPCVCLLGSFCIVRCTSGNKFIGCWVGFCFVRCSSGTCSKGASCTWRAASCASKGASCAWWV